MSTDNITTAPPQRRGKPSTPAPSFDVSGLTAEQRAELLAQLQGGAPVQRDLDQVSRQAEEDRHTQRQLARVITSLASDGNKAKYQDDVRYFRNGSEWTFYVENVSDRDTFIGDLGGKGDARESVRVLIFARSGCDFLTVTSDEENIKSSTHLTEHMRPGGPLRRLTPEEWDARQQEFIDINNWRKATTEERKRKATENSRKVDRERDLTARNSDMLRRAAKPMRPKVVALADRVRQTFPHGVSESEIINRIRTFGALNHYEKETLTASINEMLAPQAYEFIKARPSEEPNEAAIQAEINLMMTKMSRTS